MKRNKSKFITPILLILTLLYIFLPDFTHKDITQNPPAGNPPEIITDAIDEEGYYYSLEDVSGYLSAYGHLPPNYITKSEARKLGWDSDEGNLWEVADGMVIGGDTFGNREGILPKGVKYYECDVNYYGGYRGDDRIVYSSDGNIYFTSDHYNTFEHIGTFGVKK